MRSHTSFMWRGKISLRAPSPLLRATAISPVFPAHSAAGTLDRQLVPRYTRREARYRSAAPGEDAGAPGNRFSPAIAANSSARGFSRES